MASSECVGGGVGKRRGGYNLSIILVQLSYDNLSTEEGWRHLPCLINVTPAS